ncbi:ATP dependent DNA ligase-like protein [Pseudonocardia hierapolitana]|uniref:ATP dependent DNA ligase-like protein n=1 Tax=Pseudonocardia hierapolitana TaxID=1128676 RepID=A0A561SQH4_9PSEU|nr:RNA ligase family protein [Pseudonocardia hierapolitana]TWF77101.1 ATP dependent DNA ligase-like protein [Pseudonocardia hierapolitana]
MLAVPALQLPTSRRGGWAAEPKLDGFRCIALRSLGTVALQSRQCRSLTRYFPEIVDAVAELGGDVVLDGELVCWNEGRVDVAALQRRLHPSQARAQELVVAMPAAYVVFDILALPGTDVRTRPYAARRALLEDLTGLVLMPMTTDLAVARTWMLDHSHAGVEGVVVKRLTHTYRPSGGRPWLKIRTRLTGGAVVGGVLGSLDHPEALFLGRADPQRRLRVAGRTRPLSPTARAELAALLTPAAAATPGHRPSRTAGSDSYRASSATRDRSVGPDGCGRSASG